MSQPCTTCQTPMAKTGTLDSGNSTFIEYRCTNCGEQKTICSGLSTNTKQ